MLKGIDKFQKMIVCKSIELINLSNQLSLLELRLLDIYLSRINPNVLTEKEVVFSIKEFSDFFELTQTRKEKLDEALFNLKNKEYTIIDRKTKEEKKIKLFAYADFDYVEDLKTNCICLFCSDEVSKYIFKLKQYIKYDIKDIIKLSYNDYLFYLYFQSKKEFGCWKVTTKELKLFIVKDADKYNEFAGFEKILKSALKLFKKITDIEIKYRKIKKYNHVYEIEFERNYEYEDNINKMKKEEKKTTKPTKKKEKIQFEKPKTKEDQIWIENYVKEYEKVNNVEVILEEYEKTNNVKAIVEPQIEDEVKYPWEEDDDECLPFC